MSRFALHTVDFIPSFRYPTGRGWRRTPLAGSFLRMPLHRAVALLQSNSHLRDDADAQIIDSTNTARTPVAHQDLRLLGSQPNSTSDHSLTQRQALSSQSQQQFGSTQQQQRPIRTASSASFTPSPLNPTGVPPSNFANNPFPQSYPASPLPGVPFVLPATLHPCRVVRRYPLENLTIPSHAAISPTVALTLALLYLFIFYPVLTSYRDEKRNDLIQGLMLLVGIVSVFFLAKNLTSHRTNPCSLSNARTNR
jgi:hypothetical protein